MNIFSKVNKKGEMGNTNYSCSMHCEGDKTYNQPGDCPVCGMHLTKGVSPENKKNHGNKGHSCCG